MNSIKKSIIQIMSIKKYYKLYCYKELAYKENKCKLCNYKKNKLIPRSALLSLQFTRPAVPQLAYNGQQNHDQQYRNHHYHDHLYHGQQYRSQQNNDQHYHGQQLHCTTHWLTSINAFLSTGTVDRVFAFLIFIK